MQTRREYAISLGLAKPTRGRMSREANDAIAKAEAEGMTFASSGPVRTAPEDKPAKVEPTKPTDAPYRSSLEYRFPEADYIAVRLVEGKRVVYSVREACNNCGYSLCDHLCVEPSVLGYPVTIERRR